MAAVVAYHGLRRLRLRWLISTARCCSTRSSWLGRCASAADLVVFGCLSPATFDCWSVIQRRSATPTSRLMRSRRCCLRCCSFTSASMAATRARAGRLMLLVRVAVLAMMVFPLGSACDERQRLRVAVDGLIKQVVDLLDVRDVGEGQRLVAHALHDQRAAAEDPVVEVVLVADRGDAFERDVDPGAPEHPFAEHDLVGGDHEVGG